MDFEGKNIVIVGASSGIGKEIAIQLDQKGANIALLARKVDRLKDVAKSLKGKTVVVKCDVGFKDSVESAFEMVKKSMDIDGVILSAGVGGSQYKNDKPSERALKVIGINLIGQVYCIEQVMDDFKKKKSGFIAGISSVMDSFGMPGSGYYCASKAGFTRLLESLRIEVHRYGVNVITIRPGFVDTSIVKNLKKKPLLMTPQKAAAKIVKGIEKEKIRIQFPLPTIISTTLLGMIPRKIFDMIYRR